MPPHGSPVPASSSSSQQDDRLDRSIRPLGSARRPGRSRTPTPSNPHPNIASRVTKGSGEESSSSSSSSPYLQPSTRSVKGNNTKSPYSSSPPSSSRSRSTQSQAERRPWFPYPSPHTSSNGNQRSSSHTARRISTISNDSVASSTSLASSSSASSYNSEDITSRLDRRAVSAEPEQWSHSTSRGRPLHSTSMADGSRATRDNSSLKSSSGKEVITEEHESSSSDEEKERAHFKSVLHSFDAYLSHSLAANNARRRSFYSLPRSHRLLLSSLGSPLPGPLLRSDTGDQEDEASLAAAGRGFKARLDEIDDRIRRNADVLAQIVDDSRGFLGEEKEEEVEQKPVAVSQEPTQQDEAAQMTSTASGPDRQQVDALTDEIIEESKAAGGDGTSSGSKEKGGARRSRQRIPSHDLDKVRSTIKQFVRDWSQEGLSEREAAYDPILEALEMSFKHISSAQRNQLRVLVPGAGLGRLAFEIAWLGFSCQGNEFSFYMLLASHFILNKTVRVHQHIVYPFVHSSSNWRSADDMLRAIQMPDINPTDLPSHVDFSMVAGEFIEVYSKEQEKAAWNAVATCFFIDTAHNLTRYLEVINHVLSSGGVWINVGPLLWHYEGAAHGDLSIELTLDEVLGLIELMGFHIEVQRTLPPQCYTGNHGSMLSYQYSPEFWIARKIREVKPATVA